MSNQFSNGMNKEQQKAINTTNKLIVVKAGAGSGKTKVLINRALKLSSEGNKVLLTTFTRAAKKEMVDRIINASEVDNKIDVFTLNALAWRVSGFVKITSTKEIERLFKKFYKENIELFNLVFPTVSFTLKTDKEEHLDANTYHELLINGKVSKIFSMISRLECNDIIDTVENIENKDLANILIQWDKYTKENDIYDSNTIFKKAINVLKDGCDNFNYDHILIDEAQDLNYLQYNFIGMIARNKNVFMVGDPDQSIYGFRSSIDGFMTSLFVYDKFIYQDIKKINLTKNYRSTKQILKPALNCINMISIRSNKKVLESDIDGEKVTLAKFKTDKQEAKYIVDKIEDMIASNTPISEIAVLTRIHRDLNLIISELYKRKIPYTQSGIDFMNRAEMILFEAIINIIINPTDLTSANILHKVLYGNKTPLLENHGYGSAYEAITKLGVNKSKDKIITNKLNTAYNLYTNNTSPFKIINYIIDELNFHAKFKNKKDYRFLSHSIDELLLMAKECNDLEDLAILFSERRTDIEGCGKVNGSVYLGTIFSSKGLEFDSVFLPSLNLGSFPSNKIINLENNCINKDMRYHPEYIGDLDEERRMFYVAITRAKKKCVISWHEKKGISKFYIERLVSPLIYDLSMVMP